MIILYWNLDTNLVFLDRYQRRAATVGALRGEDSVQIVLLQGIPAVPVQFPAGDVVGLVVRIENNLKLGCLAGPSALAAGATDDDGYAGQTSSDTTLTRAQMHYDPADPTAELPALVGSAVCYRLPAGQTQAVESEPFPWTVEGNYFRPDQPPADALAQYPDPSVVTAGLALATSALQPSNIGQAHGGLAAYNDARIVSAYRDYATEASTTLDALIAGQTPNAATLAIFNADGSRNQAAWFARYQDDLTCQSSSSTSGWRVTAITARHFLSAKHVTALNGNGGAGGVINIGDTVTFTPNDGTPASLRTITALAATVGDQVIGTLSADLAANIHPATLMPPGLTAGVNLVGCPVLYTDQARNGYVANLATQDAGTPIADTLAVPTQVQRATFCKAGGPATDGDSSSYYGIGIGGRLICLGVFFDTNGNSPDPSANAAAIQAITGIAYPLTFANLPALGSAAFLPASAAPTPGQLIVLPPGGTLPPSILPPAQGNGGLTTVNTWTQDQTFQSGFICVGSAAFTGYISNDDQSGYLINPDGSGYLGGGVFTFDGAGNVAVQSLKSAAGIAAWGVTPPTARPTTPTTLAQVVAVLQGAGLCA